MKDFLASVYEKLKHEPVVVINFVTAALSLAVVLGVPLPAEVEAGIVSVLVAFGALYARSKVSPV